jgi:hypothetical protein
MVSITYAWREDVTNAEMNALHAEAFDTRVYEWMHVDFDDHLRPFYFDACGFTPTNAGLIEL